MKNNNFGRTNNIRKQNRPYPENLVLDIRKKESAGKMPEDIIEAVDYALSALPEREARVLYGRYKEHMSLEEAGRELGVCRDRVRQIEALALRKLRHWYPEECRLFSDGMDAYRQYIAETEREECLAAAVAMNKQPDEMLIDDLGLSARICSRLRMAGYRYVSDVAGKTRKEMRYINGFGDKSYQDLQEALKKAGF